MIKRLCYFGLAYLFTIICSCSTAKKDGAEKNASKPAGSTMPVKPEPGDKVAPSDDDDEETILAKLKCESGSDKRALKILKDSGKGCKLKYTKFGKTMTVASSKLGNQHCNKAMKKISQKLENDHFVCRE